MACLMVSAVLAGCGAGATTPTTATGSGVDGATTTPPALPGPSTGSTVGSTGSTQESSAPTDLIAPGDLVRTSKVTPKAFTDVLGRKVIVVVMYQPGDASSGILLQEIAKATRTRKNVVVIKYAPADYDKSGDLADQLDLFDIPSLAIVDRTGKLNASKTMYWPANLIASALDRAAKTKPLKTSASASATSKATSGSSGGWGFPEAENAGEASSSSVGVVSPQGSAPPPATPSGTAPTNTGD